MLIFSSVFRVKVSHGPVHPQCDIHTFPPIVLMAFSNRLSTVGNQEDSGKLLTVSSLTADGN